MPLRTAGLVFAVACAAAKPSPVDTAGPETGDSAPDSGLSGALGVELVGNDEARLALKPSTRTVQGSASLADGGLSGTVRYAYEVDGDGRCDTTLAISGTRYAGDCEGCLFAFAIDATISTDHRAPGCTLDPLWTYVPDDETTALAWAFAPSWPADVPLVWDALLTLSTSTEGETTTTPMVYVDDLGLTGTLSVEGETFAWEHTKLSDGEYRYGYHWCETLPGESADDGTGASYGGAAYLGSLDCGPAVMDTWALDAHAGDTLALTVDTVASASAFDPAFFVSGPDGCALLAADDSFACTDDASLGCPSGTLVAPEDGAYRISVWGQGHCPSGGEDYQLLVQVDPALSPPS